MTFMTFKWMHLFSLLIISFLTIRCSFDPQHQLSPISSAANGYKCDISYSSLQSRNLTGITIKDLGINREEKIRHLNELNSMPFQFLEAYREQNIRINLTSGGITSFQELSYLKGITPPEWQAVGVFTTWDSIPGTATANGVFLGNSALSNDTFSLALHEGTHALDLSLGLGQKLRMIGSLYQKMRSAGANYADISWNYRTLNVAEFLAVAVDEHFCRAESRNKQKYWYPELYSYMQSQFFQDVSQYLRVKNDPGEGATSGGITSTSQMGHSCPKSPPDHSFRCQDSMGCEAYTSISDTKTLLMCGNNPCRLTYGNSSLVTNHACSKRSGMIWYQFEITYKGEKMLVWAESKTRW